jgi:O-antigen/teichoic acid export membrane protein
MTEAITAKRMDEANDIFMRSSLNIFIPTIIVAVLLCCNLKSIADVMGNGENYRSIEVVFLILFIGRLIDTATGMNDQVLSITDNYRFTFISAVSVCVLLYVSIRIFVPKYQMIGAAWSSTGTYVAYNAAKYLFVWKKLGMQPFSKNTLVVLLCAVPAVIVGYLLPDFFSTGRHIYKFTFFDVTLRSTLILLVYVLMLLWLQPSDDLKTYLASVKKNKRLF